MAAGATYESIATITLSGTAASIDFTSIASSWTDLRVVLTAKTSDTSASGGNSIGLRFNSDTGSNYSATRMKGDGSGKSSTRLTSNSTIPLSFYNVSSDGQPSFFTVDLFSYATNIYKTILSTQSADQNGTGATVSTTGLWRSSAAVTSITLLPYNGSTNLFAIGTTATLYGIKAA